jgi:hypothetical protein
LAGGSAHAIERTTTPDLERRDLVPVTMTIEEVGAHARKFLIGLAGAWQGQAVITPIGPRPYDITFEFADTCVTGQADPGAARHRWTFCPTADGLRLRFLSTFRGNRQPRLLHAVPEREGAVVFDAPNPRELQVSVESSPNRITVRVMRQYRLHVQIEWSRPPKGD